MVNNRFILLFLWLLIKTAVLGQSLALDGHILNEMGNSISGATITVYSQDETLQHFAISDNDGKFSVPIRQSAQTIVIRSIGYNEVELLINDTWFISGKLYREIRMNTVPFELDEVIINHDNAEPDSVAITIDSLGLSETADLKDILSKLPEFKLDEDGSIIYRGRNIDKINVNGQPVFVNQNKIALKSIEKRMVDHLSILSNYKDNFKLGFEDMKQTILDIKGKEDFRNILIGDIAGGLGVSDKYEAGGKVMYFSAGLNSFFIHNTNNIGTLDLESREISGLFSEQQVFSDLDEGLLNGLLSKNQARAKDFRSNTNATVRKETSSYRIQTVAYYLLNEQAISSGERSISEQGLPILTSKEDRSQRYSTLFHNTSIDYRVKENALLDYKLITNLVNNKSQSRQEMDIYNGGSVDTSIRLTSLLRAGSNYISNNLGYTQKFSDKWISSIKLAHQVSNFNYATKITDINPDALMIALEPSFEMRALDLIAALRYRLNRSLIPSVSFSNKVVNEVIYNDGIELLKRDYSKRQLQVGLAGNDLLKYIKYNVMWELLKFNTDRDKNLYHAYKYDISYDKRLKSYYAKGSKQYYLNDISSGVTLLRDFVDIRYGNESLPYYTNRMDSHTLGYAYTNMFRGISYGGSIGYQAKYNQIQPNFTSTNSIGLRNFTLRQIPKSSDVKISVDGSKNILSTIYPLKLNGGLLYNYGNSPSYYNDVLKDVYHKGPSFTFGLMTLSPAWFNFELVTKANLYQIEIDNNSFDNHAVTNTLTLSGRKSGLEARLNFIYQYDFLYGNRFDRKNFNLTVEKRGKKLTYGFKGVNIDDFFGLFNNSAYGNYVIYDQGISTLITNDRAIRYAIIYIKYTLK